MISTQFELPFLETMVTQACNLSCVGCTNYSDIANKGWVSWAEAKEQIEPWLERITIPDFGIFGGEPLLNPEIRQWLRGTRSLLPDAQIRFTTNGVLLHKNFDLVDLAAELGNMVFKITVHTQDTTINDTIDKILARFDWHPVREFGIDRLETKNRFRLQIARPTVFWKTFRGSYSDMRPHQNDPREAFEICCQKTCPLLYKGRIYKCSTVGLLEDVLTRFDRPNWQQWQPFLSAGLDAHCSDQELQNFINNFGKPNAVCGQCPSKRDMESRIIHLHNVGKQKTRL